MLKLSFKRIVIIAVLKPEKAVLGTRWIYLICYFTKCSLNDNYYMT